MSSFHDTIPRKSCEDEKAPMVTNRVTTYPILQLRATAEKDHPFRNGWTGRFG